MACPDDKGWRRHPISEAVEAMQASRRRFLQAGIAGALAASLPLLSACGGDDGDHGLTLFFNYAHLDTAGKTMWLRLGRRSYRVRPIAELPHALARERRHNRFLRELDDRYITHVVEGVPAPQPSVVAFHYGVTEGANGQWTMDSVNILLPEAAATAAFQRLSDALGGQALPLSAKRRKYGLPPARSARDLYEEQALQDPVSHAATLVTMQKDMLALDGNAASTVVNNYVMQSLDVDDIDDAIGQLGTAAPEQNPGKTNAQGWATLRPLPAANGQPRRIVKPGDPANGRIVYMPVLHPELVTLVGKAVKNILPGVQNDATLGADITDKPAGSTLRGALWVRRDGQPTVTAGQSVATPAVAMTVTWPNGQNHWLDCTATATPLGGGTQQLEVSYSNIALRYLSCFIEFYDESGKLLTLGTMPGFAEGSWVTSPPGFSYDPSEDGGKTRIGIGTVSSLGTVMGIPVFTDSAFYGSLDISLKLSESVHRVRLYAGGLGTGSNNHADTIAGGVAGTLIVNYILTTLFGALGAIPDLDQAFSLILAGGEALINAFAAQINDSTINGNDFLTLQWWEDQGINLLNFLLAVVAGSNDPILKSFGEGLAELIGEAEAEAAIEESIPVVGIILAVESAVVAAADFTLTTVAIAQSPFTYITDLVFTHDITVTVHHSGGDTSFPKAANLMTVIATFDDGQPHRLDFPLTSPPYPQSLPPVVFKGAPLGGGVDITVNFYQTNPGNDAAQNILLGRGSTGRVANDANQGYSITIAEKAFPVGPNTHYQHVQRSYLDHGGAHIWVKEGAPSTPPSQFPCGSAGEICQFDGIAVRQGTTATATMLGYAWRGQNQAGGGDLGQQALMNAENPGAGYALASNAQAVAGLDIAFSVTAGGANNFYVDPSGAQPMIRGITLDSGGNPSFDGPGSNRAYGMLNLASDLLLVHPAGYLVSISGANDRFEVLNPPATAVSDAAAREQLIAQVVGGSGVLPGRLSNVAAATIAKDGTLLLLENGNNRIQAFDIGCNPVRYFGRTTKTYFLDLSEMPTAAGWQHLDIQADVGGLLYVLSTNTQSGVYRLSIYDRLAQRQQALSVTEGIFAARIGLDHWRDLYTLNYQPVTVQGSNTKPAITEPSVSLWTPVD